MEIMYVPIVIIAVAIAFDITVSNGKGLNNIFSAFRKKAGISPEESNRKIISDLLEDLDSLREEYEYFYGKKDLKEDELREMSTLELKIKDREKLLEKYSR